MELTAKNKKIPSRDWIKGKVLKNDYFNSEHIVRNLTQGDFTVSQIENVLVEGKIIETHFHPLRGVCWVCLGTPENKAAHVVFTKDNDGHLIVLLAYRPALPVWEDEKTRAKGDLEMSRLKKCFFCSSKIEPITVGNFDFRWEGDLYVIKNVPAGLCVQCGEKYISAEASNEIVAMIDGRQFSGEDSVKVFNYNQGAAGIE